MENFKKKINTIIEGDTLNVLKTFPDESIDLIITSPPYYGLRDYGVKGQVGLEPTIDEYLKKMLEITAELKRVLKKSGQFFLNMGDSYGGSSKSKCLLMQPERLAINMIDQQGWLLRNKIKWAKQVYLQKKGKTVGSVMPSSVKDRFNESGEEFYFFVKSKKYYSNLDAVRIPIQTFENRLQGIIKEREFGYDTEYPQVRAKFNLRVRDAERKAGQPQYKATKEEIERYKQKRYNEVPENYGKKKLIGLDKKEKNKLNRWMSGTPNYTYQEKSLEERMTDTKNKNTKQSRTYNIKKLLSEVRLGIKPNTGMVKNKVNDPRGNHLGGPGSWRDFKDENPSSSNIKGKNLPTVWLIGTEPHNFKKELNLDVEHFAMFPTALLDIPIKFGSPKDGIVLDPFSGAGTTALVAKKLSRNYIGIELNPEYIKIAKKRLKHVQKPLL